MKTIPFWKVESIGNDFVLVHLDDIERLRGDASAGDILVRLTIKTCARRFGIGSDGLLALAMQPDGSILQRMFNPDGTEDFCGNGIRCGFDHALRLGWLEPGQEMRMSHLGRSITGRAIDRCDPLERVQPGVRPSGPKRFQIEFVLPPATYTPQEIPLRRDEEAFDTPLLDIDGFSYVGSVLSTGTAHTILPVKELPSDEEFYRVSPRIEADTMFPERTSVMWVMEDGPNDIRMRVWERGVGETQGCGTGSVAAAMDYLRRKGTGGCVEVRNPGGKLSVTATSWNSPPSVGGFAEEVFAGEFPI